MLTPWMDCIMICSSGFLCSPTRQNWLGSFANAVTNQIPPGPGLNGLGSEVKALINPRDQPRRPPLVFLVLHPELRREQPLLRPDASGQGHQQPPGQQHTYERAECQPPAGRVDQQSQVARMAEHVVDPVGDQTVSLLDGDQSAEAV